MISRFFKSKLFLFFSILLFTGFVAGYDYAVVTSREPAAAVVKAPVEIPSGSGFLPEEAGEEEDE